MGSIFHRLCGFTSPRSGEAPHSGDAASEPSIQAGAPDESVRNRVPSAVSTVGELHPGSTPRRLEGVRGQVSPPPVNTVAAPRQLLTELPQLYVDFVQLQFIELIGRGSFKTVYRGRWANTAVAIVGMRRGGLVNEARILHRLSNHPNVIQFFRWTSDDAGNEYMIVELAKWGSLDKMLSARGPTMPTSVKLMICEQICSAMCELAEQNVLHRDLAARNVLVLSMDPVHVKVTDFGLARLITPGESAPAGTTSNGTVPVRSTPPEVLLSGKWSEKSDVWSYGITLWEIMSNGAEPYASKTDAEVVKAVVQGELLPRPLKCPRDLYSLMLSCWAHAPEERPSFSDIARTFREWRDAYQVTRSAALPRSLFPSWRSSNSHQSVHEAGGQAGQVRQLSPLRSAVGAAHLHQQSQSTSQRAPYPSGASSLQRAAVAAAASGLAGGPETEGREGGQEALIAGPSSRAGAGAGSPGARSGLPFAQEGQPSTQHNDFLTEGYVSNSSRVTPGQNYTMPQLARRTSALQGPPPGVAAISAAPGGSWHGTTAEAASAAAQGATPTKGSAEPGASGQRSEAMLTLHEGVGEESAGVQDPNIASPVQGLATEVRDRTAQPPAPPGSSRLLLGGTSPAAGAPRPLPALMLHTAATSSGPSSHLLYPAQQQQQFPASAPISQSHSPGTRVSELVGVMAGGGGSRGMQANSRNSGSSGGSGARRRGVGLSLSESGSTSQANPSSQQDLFINTGDHLDQSEVQQMLEQHQPASSSSASVRAQTPAHRGGDTPTRVYSAAAQHVMLHVGRAAFRSSGGSREVGMESGGMTMETAHMSFDVEPILDPQSIVITQDHLTTNQAGLLSSTHTPRWDRLRGQASVEGVPSPTALLMPAALQNGGGLLLPASVHHAYASGRPPSLRSSSPRPPTSASPSAASTSAASLPLVGRPPGSSSFSPLSASSIPLPSFLASERPRLAAAKPTAETLLPVLRQAEVGGVAAAAAAMMEAGARESLARTSGVENISFQLPVLPDQHQTGSEAAPLVPSLPALSGFVTMGELSTQPGFGGQLRPLPPPGTAPAQPFFNLGLTEFAASVRSQPQQSSTPAPPANSGYMSVRAAVEIAHAHQHSSQYRKSS